MSHDSPQAAWKDSQPPEGAFRAHPEAAADSSAVRLLLRMGQADCEGRLAQAYRKPPARN